MNNPNFSYINSKAIKGKSLNLKDNIYLSVSQGLEWFKNMQFSPNLEDLEYFNPF